MIHLTDTHGCVELFPEITQLKMYISYFPLLPDQSAFSDDKSSPSIKGNKKCNQLDFVSDSVTIFADRGKSRR